MTFVGIRGGRSRGETPFRRPTLNMTAGIGFSLFFLLLAGTGSGSLAEPAKDASPAPAPEFAQTPESPQAADAKVPAMLPKVECAKAADLINKAKGEERQRLTRAAIVQKCKPLPPTVWSAVQTGRWADDDSLSSAERLWLLSTGAESAYPEAETLAVQVLEKGQWPDGKSLQLSEGARLIDSLEPVLNPYRVRLLLDIYEQVEDYTVRRAVLQTLKVSDLPEALVPALDAHWRGDEHLKKLSAATFTQKKETSPDAVLARVIRTLPEGPVLDWAVRIAEGNTSPLVAEALKTRGH